MFLRNLSDAPLGDSRESHLQRVHQGSCALKEIHAYHEDGDRIA